MSSQTAPAVAPTSTGDDDDDLVHTFCYCDEDTSLCGVDLAGIPTGEEEDGDLPCVVCVDLDPLPCERCGE